MSKSMYSLILSDEVVRAVDEIAYSASTSRSNMINQILAEYCCFTTPEKTMKDIFEHLINILDPVETFKIQLQPSDAMLSIKSPLRFRYNPTIRYSVELFPYPDGALGELKVVTRTQNNTLLDVLQEFFELFIIVERQFVKGLGINFFPKCEICEGRFIRELYLIGEREKCNNEQIGRGIAEYIRMLDSCLKTYLSSGEAATGKIKKIYGQYLSSRPIII